MNNLSVLKELQNFVKTKRADYTIDDQTFEQASIVEVLNADSLDLIRLVVILENKFGVDLPDEMISNVGTFGDLARVICVANPI